MKQYKRTAKSLKLQLKAIILGRMQSKQDGKQMEKRNKQENKKKKETTTL